MKYENYTAFIILYIYNIIYSKLYTKRANVFLLNTSKCIHIAYVHKHLLYNFNYNHNRAYPKLRVESAVIAGGFDTIQKMLQWHVLDFI